MPTNYSDQFFDLDPAWPLPVGTPVDVQNYELVDQDDDGDIGAGGGDTVNGQEVLISFPGDTVTIDVAGVGEVTYTGITFILYDFSVVFTPTDGQVLQSGTFVSSTYVNTDGPLHTETDLGPPCFTPGTLISTPIGERPIEDLKAGDLVTTLDNGPQPVLWIGQTTVAAEGRFAPVRFEAGVFGLNLPLLVSPQHRMLLDDWRASYLYGQSEVLIAAHCLINGENVKRVEGGKVTYIHLLFARHEIIIANGA